MSAGGASRYEVVIGLEVHVHLGTRTKMFCGCAIRYDAEPNHQTCPVCLALPGALPVANGRAVDLAVRTGLAAHCTIHPRSIYARKNYFYPDLPKGYQISQFEEPLCTDGWVEVEVEEQGGARLKHVRITRIHMEEDAGKSIHANALAGSDHSLVDLNRCGVPLVEIVSEPDLRTPAEASAYLRAWRTLLRYLDVSDADMQKGQMRCDANVSLLPRGASELGTRTELKNLNSFRFVELALAAEIDRQAETLDAGGQIVQATLHYDPVSNRSHVMRIKENADDYRYFPDPDLVPVLVDEARIEEIRASLPELADAKRERFQRDYGLSEDDARRLSASRRLADFFEEAAGVHGRAKAVANWMSRDLLQALKERNVEVEEAAITPVALARLIQLVDAGRVTVRSARELVPELVERGGDPERLVQEKGLEAVSDPGLIESAVERVLSEQAESAARYRAGEQKVLNFLMGQVMKATQGKATPDAVREILKRRLAG